jgi:hypothetical protein
VCGLFVVRVQIPSQHMPFIANDEQTLSLRPVGCVLQSAVGMRVLITARKATVIAMTTLQSYQMRQAACACDWTTAGTAQRFFQPK